MADAPLADYQTVLGYQGLVGQNPYLTYQGAIPMPGYRGTPTDASGRPIQSYLDATAAANAQYQQQLAAYNAQKQQTPGTTLNSNTYGMSPQVFNALQQQGVQPSQMPAAGIGAGIAAGQGMPAGLQGMFGRNFAAFRTPQQAQDTQSSSAPQPPSPPDMRQAYLDALANPGKVTTPGAQIYPGAAQTGAPQPSVLDQFLANNRASTGAGGYTNAPFFQTLNALKNAGGSV